MAATKKSASTKKQTGKTKAKVGKVMGEAKRGTLKSGPGGKGGKVKSRKQAIAIALSEAGASRKQTGKKKTVAKKSTAKKTTTKKRGPGRPKKSA